MFGAGSLLKIVITIVPSITPSTQTNLRHPILIVSKLKEQSKRDGSIIVSSCEACQSPVCRYPIRAWRTHLPAVPGTVVLVRRSGLSGNQERQHVYAGTCESAKCFERNHVRSGLYLSGLPVLSAAPMLSPVTEAVIRSVRWRKRNRRKS